MGNPQIPAEAFRADLQTTFVTTYEKQAVASPKLSAFMALDVPSDKRAEIYGYPESMPTIDRWERGEPIPREESRIVTYEIFNEDWGKAFEYHENDLDDLKLIEGRTWVRGLAKRAGQVPERVAFQLIDGTTNAKLLPSIPLAPDGAALFAATAGGAARFGVTGGNIVTGNGYSGAAIRATLMGLVIPRFMAFKDTKSEPLLDQSQIENRLVILANSDYYEGFAEAFSQAITRSDGPAGSAGVTNIVMDSGLTIELWLTQRKSVDNWIVVAPNAGPPPLVWQKRAAVRTIDEDRTNSDRARNTKQNSFQVDFRAGAGMNLPFAAIQVDEA